MGLRAAQGRHAGARLRASIAAACPAPFRARVLVWLLCWLVLAHLVFGAVAAGAMAGTLASDPQFCTAQMDSDGDGGGAGHQSVHCILCPLAGGTPPLPAPQGSLVAPDLAFARHVSAPQTSPLSLPRPPQHDHARPRAPPASAA